MKLIPTAQQQTIIDEAKKGKNLIIKARAGSSKTTTCEMIAEAINTHSLYVAFNKVIATEAESRFPDTVTSRTMHSLAYRDIINTGFKNKLQAFYDYSDIKELESYKQLNADIKETVLYIVVEQIKAFCQSAYTALDKLQVDTDLEKIALPVTKEYWKELVNPKSKTKITHDIYLKLFQLTKPYLGYSVVYLDEAQDSNEVIIDIVLQQSNYGSQVIVVGDEYQAIYGWRGAINALDKFGYLNYKELYLTESFRFTQEIADLAHKVIAYLGNTKELIGRAKPCITYKDKAILVRNNSTLIQELLNAVDNYHNVYVLGDLKDLWSKLYHVNALRFGDTVKYPNKELRQYKTYKELKEAAESVPELNKLISIVSLLCNNGGVHKAITEMKKVIVKTPEEADYTLATGHKSKGLEWDEVTLREDFYQPKENETFKDFLNTEQAGQLLYVAITRAKYKVNLPVELQMELL